MHARSGHLGRVAARGLLTLNGSLMQRFPNRCSAAPGERRLRFAALAAVTVALAACGAKSPDTAAGIAAGTSKAATRSAAATHIVACTLMPKEEMNALTGATFTTAVPTDDALSFESRCQYAAEGDPSSMSLDVQWLDPHDYSDPATHAALQKASMGGAKLGGKLTEGISGSGPPGMPPSGPVDGIGDEATLNMMLLTARKGDYTISVQIIPSNMMALMTDSTYGKALVGKEKAVALKTLAKL